LKKAIAIFLLTALGASCSVKYLFVKREATPEIISSANTSKDYCRSGKLDSCHEYIKIFDKYELGFKNSFDANNDMAVLLTIVCLEKNLDDLCPVAARTSNKVNNSELLKKICFSKKLKDSCIYAADLVFSDSNEDQLLGLKAISYACTNPNSISCDRLLKKSIELSQNGYLVERCSKGVAEGCMHSAFYGREKNEDPRKRLKFYQKACSLGEKEACELKTLIPESIALWDCEIKKNTKACREATSLLISKNKNEAKKYAQIGCSANDSFSCSQHQQIELLIAEESRQNAMAWAVIAQGFAAGLQAGAQANTTQTDPGYVDYTSQDQNIYPSRSISSSPYSNSCGLKPFPPIGYEVGRCVNGQWEMVSKESQKTMNCGFKPFPNLGYEVGRCVNGQWEMVSKESQKTMNCGFKPFPNLGCTIGRCVAGQWEQICK
jgi:hypothetical protein